MTERNLDLFKTLDSISKKKRAYYAELTEEEQKEFAPLVFMRWLSGTKDQGQIVFLNEFVNPYVFDLSKHKELLYKLMTVCTDGTFKRYTWIKAKGKSIPSMPVSVDVIKAFYPNHSNRDAINALKIFNETDILEMAEQLGFEKDNITKIKAEFKKLK
jgi:hypothetical protein